MIDKVESDLVRWPAEGYRRVPYEVLHSPDVYALEQERIFRGPVWHYVALEAELADPGDFKTAFIGDTPVVITRGREGQLHGFVNRCAHRGSLVCLESSGKGRNGFTCVYHAWSYDQRGRLTGAAFRKGLRGEGGLPATFEFKDHGLQSVRIETLHGVAFGTLSELAPPLLEYIGDAAGPFERAFSRKIQVLGYDTQVIHANWKSYAENGRDTFHANILHSFFGTFGISRQSQESAIVTDPHGHYYTYTKRGTESDTSDYDQVASSLRSVKADFELADKRLLEWDDEFGDGASTFLTALFPLFMIQQVQHSLAVRVIMPKAPNHTELLFTYFGYEDDTPELRRRRLENHNLTGSAGLVSMEDGAVCEFVDQGTAGSSFTDSSFLEMGGIDLSSGTTKLSERPLRVFWNAYRELMEI